LTFTGKKLAMPTFAEYLEKWLKQSTAQGLSNPLVKMPVKRFRRLEPTEFDSLANGGTLIIGTMADPIARNLHKNYQTRIRERGERCAFVCSGSVEMIVAGGTDGKQRKQLFPVCLKRASFQTSGDKIKAVVAEDEVWQFNPVLQAHIRGLAITVPESVMDNPVQATNWVRAQLGNRASQVTSDGYVGLFSSQQMVVQNRLTDPPLRQALAKNPIVQAKVSGNRIGAVDLGEISDDELEELGLALPCDDSQLRVVQLSHNGHCLQVEGPPGTGKSQTIANIISNALYHGRNVLLVCDKKAAIVQVEERLSDVGLKPAMLNLHDEDLNKREFLKQAASKFATGQNTRVYPFTQLQEARKALNERVKFGRAIAHPSLQVAKREALAGMIQLRKELKNVPNIPISNWQSLSKERLTKLLSCLGEWPDLAGVLTDNRNVWNKVRVEHFDDNPNATNELQALVQETVLRIESLQAVREWAATVGIEIPLNSDANVTDVLALVMTVLEKPACHPKLIGNEGVSLIEVEHLNSQWKRREKLVATRHPVPLEEIYPSDAKHEAEKLLAAETAKSWEDLSKRENYHKDKHGEIEASQKNYRRLCDQIGLVYSPLIKTRRAQLQAVLSVASFGTTIPRSWWKQDTTPVLTVAGWKAHFQACATHAKNSPLPLHFVALESVATTHWKYVESKAEHGFNLVSYCLNFVNDRKCKYALRQVFPAIPTRGFKQWQEVTLHAVATFRTVGSLRSAAETHVVLKQLTSAYLAVAHEESDHIKKFLSRDEVQALESVSAIVEQVRERNDLFEVSNAHWQTFWESVNANLLASVQAAVVELDRLVLPDGQQTDDLEEASKFYDASRQRVQKFIQDFEKQEGDRTNSVIAAFAAQREFAHCQEQLAPLPKYLVLSSHNQTVPDWKWLHEIIAWRDLFERLRGQQKLDIDSQLWSKLRDRLQNHQAAMTQDYVGLENPFEGCTSYLTDYDSLIALITEILGELPRRPLWLEKKRWQEKISAFPEIKALWNKILESTVRPQQAQRLFCFNLLRLCDPIAKPHGLEFKQTLKAFAEHDEKLDSWVIDHMKANLSKKMDIAADEAAYSEGELRQLAGMQRIHGTVRELANAHLDYLLAAKRCWLMSPTSLANLIDSKIFEENRVPFDLVIFDEASQIRVLDGLFSMSFGKQVIIVGDKNQLPPTDFFAGFATPEEEAEDFGASESLLEEFGGVFEEDKTQVMLMSHYRSETPDLIRFSNDRFYGGKLEMYPPAHVTGIGRRLHYIPDAIYSESGQRNNPAEAKEVVKLIELHVREHPEKSLGVVTMNISQMELIEELLLDVSEKVRTFCSDESRFFLRNLETVQGDEMDRIILSLTYGKNAAGQFNASVLGPLNKGGGERRLNVAITRSRNGMIIVTSLRVADLLATSAHSRGFNCLKDFLAELESTEQARTFGIGSKKFERRNDGVSNIVYCESPFEEQVVEFLENEGYEIECQYGAGKFRLDIVVKERGKNILAIECDGAAYHSSLVARTRDRARQRVLEKLGWRIHRVWSTNWWQFEQQEKDGIIAAINSVRG
jgi:very-short-patch-repair endonuclease